MNRSLVLAGWLIYVVIARACLLLPSGRARMIPFALVNVAAVWLLLYPATGSLYSAHGAAFGAYLALVTVQYLMLSRFGDREGWQPWLAFFTPLAALVLIKFGPLAWRLLTHPAGKPTPMTHPYVFLGLSYLAFRASNLVLEIRNGLVTKPGFWQYLSFCFFLPTMSVGPITSYTHFAAGFSGPDRQALPLGRCLLRVLVGLAKFKFLTPICFQLTYEPLLLDGHAHSAWDLILAMFCYSLYLYCNFSGFCDIAIGIAGLLGFPVAENFRDPLLARNLQDFWNRWHITFSKYMRDVVFTPLSKWLIGTFGVAHANAAIAVSIFTVFLLVGIWHGVGWNFVVFGAANGLGLVAVHFYGVGLKKWLGKAGHKTYQQSIWIQALAMAVTFAYVSFCLCFFANDFPSLHKILAAVR